MAAPDTINVITTQLAAGRGPDQWDRRTVERPTPVADLKAGYDAFLLQVHAILKDSKCARLEEFQLEEVTFTAEIDPNGAFKLVGTGAAETVGGVRFTLKRRHTPETADLVRLLVGTKSTDDPAETRFDSNDYVRGEKDGKPVRVEVTGTVPVAEQNLPLPVVGL
jgi:hypothetical protein